jgi:hypothetical protein
MLQVCEDQLLRLNAEMHKQLGTVHGDIGHVLAEVPPPDALSADRRHADGHGLPEGEPQRVFLGV